MEDPELFTKKCYRNQTQGQDLETLHTTRELLSCVLCSPFIPADPFGFPLQGDDREMDASTPIFDWKSSFGPRVGHVPYLLNLYQKVLYNGEWGKGWSKERETCCLAEKKDEKMLVADRNAGFSVQYIYTVMWQYQTTNPLVVFQKSTTDLTVLWFPHRE